MLTSIEDRISLAKLSKPATNYHCQQDMYNLHPIMWAAEDSSSSCSGGGGGATKTGLLPVENGLDVLEDTQLVTAAGIFIVQSNVKLMLPRTTKTKVKAALRKLHVTQWKIRASYTGSSRQDLVKYTTRNTSQRSSLSGRAAFFTNTT